MKRNGFIRRSCALLICLAFLMAAACHEHEKEAAGQDDGKAFSPFAAQDRGEGRLRVKEPVVAGKFYPDDKATLAAMVNRFLNGAAKSAHIDGDVFGLIAPHAGYPFSGPVAGSAFAAVKGKRYDRVVVIGPSHRERTPPVAILDVDRYRTPLGELSIDRAATLALIDGADWIRPAPRVFDIEHSLEVELPFIQTAVGDVPVVLLAMTDQRLETAKKLARLLDKQFASQRTLFVASSDLSHYYPYDVAGKMDARTLSLIEEQKTESLAKLAAGPKRELEACGIGPILTLMELYRMRGGDDVRILKYMNSGDTGAGKDRVVGYGAAAFVGGRQGGGEMAGDYLTVEDKKELLRIARKTVEEFVRTGKKPAFDAASAVLGENGAAFVTLRKGDHLRGCIGHVVAREPLHLCVRDMAVAAASEDPRFPPVKPDELDDIDIEVSVLTPMEPVADPKSIQVGRDGLMIRKGFRQGLLLPQVPDEYDWDRVTFLEQTCRKAGLPKDAWKDGDTEILSFQAIVFDEDTL